MSIAQLIATLATTPDLPGASCVSSRQVFDKCTDGHAGDRELAAAVRVCAGCPVLGPCASWVDSLDPRKRPFGVTGARIRRSR